MKLDVGRFRHFRHGTGERDLLASNVRIRHRRSRGRSFGATIFSKWQAPSFTASSK